MKQNNQSETRPVSSADCSPNTTHTFSSSHPSICPSSPNCLIIIVVTILSALALLSLLLCLLFHLCVSDRKSSEGVDPETSALLVGVSKLPLYCHRNVRVEVKYRCENCYFHISFILVTSPTVWMKDFCSS